MQADDISTGLVGYLRRQPLELALDAMWELRFAHLDCVRNVSGYLMGITRWTSVAKVTAGSLFTLKSFQWHG